jgi:DNA-directed RNA polymerase specialized sigma24 family protein
MPRPIWDPPASDSTPQHVAPRPRAERPYREAIALLSDEQRLVFVAARVTRASNYGTIAAMSAHRGSAPCATRLYRAKEILRRRLQPLPRVEPV